MHKLLESLCLCSCFLILLVAGSPAQPAKPGTPQVENHRRGTEPAEVVKVGLLLRNQQQSGLAAKRSAEMAVVEANSKGGYHGRRFELIVRSVDGPWGAGSKEIVKLAFEEDVWAILASLDGRSAHLVEQIVAKGRIALVSTWASEATLTQINIPWFFRCVPDDRQQAEALLKEIYPKRGLQRVAAVAAQTYDARMAAAAFSRAAATAGYRRPIELSYASDRDFPVIFNSIEDDDIEGVVLFGSPESTAKLVKQMHARGLKHALFAHLPLAEDALLISAKLGLKGVVVVEPGHWRTSAGQHFQQKYQLLYGARPGAEAAYAYDGMRLILKAIRTSGLDRGKIRDALANINYSQGVTGAIRFDRRGNRIGPVHLVEIIDGSVDL